MYGYAMRVRSDNLELVLRPYAQGEHEHLLPGMQSCHVLGHTSFRRGLTLADAKGYLERLEASPLETGWAVCAVTQGGELPIGTTTLECQERNRRRAESGIVIYNRDWWKRGVATLSHAARTLYAFDIMGLAAIDSSADQANHGSCRALERTGYVQTGVDYHIGVHQGDVVHLDRFLLVNPAKGPWRNFWGAGQIPPPFKAGRARTRQVLARARLQVEFL